MNRDCVFIKVFLLKNIVQQYWDLGITFCDEISSICSIEGGMGLLSRDSSSSFGTNGG
jgi:hypothetical protein